MSIIAGLHAGRYVMLAADCLLWEYCDHTLETLADERRAPKIVSSPIGFLAAVGVIPLIDAVTRGLERDPPDSGDDVLQTILAARRTLPEWAEHELLQHGLKGTSWMVTYRLEADAQQAAVVRVALYEPKVNDAALLNIGPGTMYACMSASAFERHYDACASQVHECKRAEDEGASLAHHAGVLRELLDRCAADPDAKSSAEGTLAAQFADGRSLLTDVLGPGDPLVWH